jgi:hypothetical protein
MSQGIGAGLVRMWSVCTSGSQPFGAGLVRIWSVCTSGSQPFGARGTLAILIYFAAH